MFPLLSLITYLIVTKLNLAVDPYYLRNPALIPVVFFQILLVGGALGEEFGWRGYALGRLQKLFSPFWATLILGLVWSLWHLPLFFVEGTTQAAIPIWQFVFQTMVLAFYYTWIYNKTKGNLFLMILLHAVSNTSSAVFTYWYTDTGRWIGFVLMLVPPLVYIIINRAGRKKIQAI